MTGFPLKGLKVLDFSRVLAGPFATRMLADLGAEVLKIEPPEGDVTRIFGVRGEGATGFYLQQNIGKRNVCIDMKAPGARELVLKLAAEADLAVENFRPGVMQRFGIGWEDLHAVNPKLVLLSISGFGQEGPERERAAYAPVLHAETGIIARQARMADGHAVDIQYSLADTYSGLHGLVAALAALRVAEQTGEGQHIDIAMLNVIFATDDYIHWALDGAVPEKGDKTIWEAPEGGQILISGDLKWLWEVFSKRDGLADPTPPGADLETKIGLRRDAIAEKIRSFPTFDALTAKLDALNLAWGKVRDFGEECLAEPSVGPRGVIVDVEDDAGRARRIMQTPYRFSKSEAGIAAGSRLERQGESNASALREWLSIGEEEVAALTEQGILQQGRKKSSAA